MPERERRFLRTAEMRAEEKDGKQYLTGYAARYGVLSHDLGGFRERIAPGTFQRAIADRADVRHLINHDPSRILGRTAAGTLSLSEDDKGLAFRCEMPDTSYGRDLVESVRRGDINECSFSFAPAQQAWIEEKGEDGKTAMVRELRDVDLFDTSTVTYPAYPETSAAMERSLFPEGVPAEIRSHVPGIDHAKKKTKRVDGEDLTEDCFLIVGDPDDTTTWKLPWKFSTTEKTISHLRNALARFGQLKGVSEEEKAGAWKKLVSLCGHYGIDVGDKDRSLRAKGDEDGDGDGDSNPDDCTCPCDSCQEGDCGECDCDGCGSDRCDAEECRCGDDERMRMKLRLARHA